MTSGSSPDIESAVRFVQEWLTEAASGSHGGLDTGAPECAACPVCRAAALLRTADPAAVATVIGGVLDVALTAAEGLRAVADNLLATEPERAEPVEADQDPDPSQVDARDHEPGHQEAPSSHSREAS